MTWADIQGWLLGGLGALVAAGSLYALKVSSTRRQISSDGVSVAQDDASKGIISRLQDREKYLAEELKQEQELRQALMERYGAASDRIARLEGDRDLWRSAARRLAKRVAPEVAEAILPSNVMPLGPPELPP
jgi:hypothetical protein